MTATQPATTNGNSASTSPKCITKCTKTGGSWSDHAFTVTLCDADGNPAPAKN